MIAKYITDKCKLSVIRVWKDPSRYNTVLKRKRARQWGCKGGFEYIPKWRVYAERMPASFGCFTIRQLKEIITEIELFPDKEKHTFNFNEPNNVYYVVRIIKPDEPST